MNTTYKALFALSAALLTAQVFAEESKTYLWTDVYAEGKLPEGVTDIQKDGTLRIEGAPGTAVTIPLMTIDAPFVTAKVYAVTGTIQYFAVEGDGYLELLNYYPGNACYFTRTLSGFGPMAKITGSSDSREFTLPFIRNEDTPRPERLKVNLVLPEGGSVIISPITLKNVGDSPAGLGISTSIMSSIWMKVFWAVIILIVLLIMGLSVRNNIANKRAAEDVEARKMKAMDL